MRRLAACALLAALARPGSLGAEGGTTAAQTLRRPLGARAIALGEAYAAADGGVDSLGYNPAGTASAKKPALESSYTHGIIDDKFSFTGYLHPAPFGTISAGLLYYDAGSIHLSLSNGTNETRKAQQDLAALFGLAVPLPGGLSAGILAKAYRFELAEEARATGFAADAGLIWHTPLSGLNLGASLQHLGPDVKFEQEGDPLPLTTRFGAAYRIGGEDDQVKTGEASRFTQFLVTADMVKVRQERLAASAGLEMSMPLGSAGRAALRGGYLVNRDLDALSVGVGLREGRFSFDYAVSVKRQVQNAHHVTLGYHF